ncbi:dockerin type I repeat-containing protein, partial [Ruminococcus sp.]|uniref:dockerin type I repeat-containing protein n=1 Tax=Ruminococcus sp. TaxID=41978 RepID=UPI00386E5205
SKKTIAAFWRDMDATKYGPVLQISSIGNVVGTCPEAGKTPESIFTDFLTVVDSETGTTTYANAYHYMVESGRKTDQQLIDDIGAGLGLNKDQVQAAFTDNEVETTWSYDASTLPAGTTPHTHTPGEAVQENVVPASCTAEGSYDEVVYCTECGEEISRETKTIDKLAHTPGEPVQENVVPASCKAEGSYDEVVYCTKCNEELSRETKTIDKLAHTPGEPVQENVVPASCSAEGSYDEVVYCTECGEKLSQTHKTIDKLPHTPGGEVIENREVTHDYTQYEVVHYCTDCYIELSRETVQEPIITHTLTYVPEVPATEEAEGTKAHYTCSGCDMLFSDPAGTVEVSKADLVIPKLTHTHTPGEEVRENEVPATCKAEGSYDVVVYCTACGEEISRETKTIDKLAHTPAEAVQENIVPASCTAEGSYDEVVYCSECGEELSREAKTIDMVKHTIKIKPGRAATTEADGWKTHFYCTECGKLFTNFSGTNETTWEDVRIPRIVIGKLGDVDGSGEVDILDVTTIQRVLANVKPADDTINKLGDVDGDGSLDVTDATLLQRWLLGLNQDLKIGEDV